MRKTKKQSAKISRKGLVAVALACALLLATGSWAWQSFQSLTASNILKTATYNVELHDLFNGVDQVSNSKDLKNGGTAPAAVTLEDWPADVNTPKQIWLKNPADSSGPIFVRLQLTEIITGGDAPYSVTGDVFDGTTAADVAEPSLISWGLGDVRDLSSWNGTDFGDFWLMDTDTGYAYYMNRLMPGDTTDEFLSSIKLLAEQENELTYNINVKADAISATVDSDRTQWGASANDTKLDGLFDLYKDWVSGNLVIFSGINDGGAGQAKFEAAFPDPVLNAWVKDNVDTNSDGDITQGELDAVTSVDLSYSGVADLLGIELFTNLENLNVQNAALSGHIDLSNNINLKTIVLYNNTINSIDISKLEDLERLALANNALSSIDISSNMKLKDIELQLNNFTELNFANHPSLEKVQARNNPLLKSFNLSNCYNLLNVRVYSCSLLKEMNFSGCSNLTYVEINGNAIETLNISGVPKLQTLAIQLNNISGLDLSECPELTSLLCRDNGMTSLNLSGCTKLISLQCQNNRLSTLDVSDCPLTTAFNYANQKPDGTTVVNLVSGSTLIGWPKP